MFHHIYNTATIFSALNNLKSLWICDALNTVRDYPPVYYLTAIMLKAIFGWLTPKAIFFTSSIFFIILVFSVYFISELFIINSGLLSALIILLYPPIYCSLYQFNLEMASIAMTALCFLMLLRMYLDTNVKNIYGAAIVMILTMLTRQFLIIFFALPLGYIIFGIFKNENKLVKKHFILAVIVSIMFCVPYYCAFAPLKHMAGATFGALIKQGGVLQLTQSLIVMVFCKGTGPIFMILAFFCLIFFVVTPWRNKIIFLLWLASPFVSINLVNIGINITQQYDLLHSVPKTYIQFAEFQSSYILPILSGIAVLTGVVLSKILLNSKMLFYVIVLIFFLGGFYPGTFFKDMWRLSANREPIYRFFDDQASAREFFFGLQKDKIMGLASFGAAPEQYGLFTRVQSVLFSEGLNEPKVIDFFSDPRAFLRNLDNFNYVVIAREDCNAVWPEDEYLHLEIKKFYSERHLNFPFRRDSQGKIYLPGDDMSFFSKAGKDYALYKKLTYFILPDNVPVYLYCYKHNDKSKGNNRGCI